MAIKFDGVAGILFENTDSVNNYKTQRFAGTDAIATSFTLGTDTFRTDIRDWSYSSFMWTYAAWVDGGTNVGSGARYMSVLRQINITVGQNYTFRAQADDEMKVYVDDFTSSVMTTIGFREGQDVYYTVYLAPGIHNIRMDVYNAGGPAGYAMTMTGADGVLYWSTLTSATNRVSGVTYTNTLGRPMVLYICADNKNWAYPLYINGNIVMCINGFGTLTGGMFIIPTGATYMIDFNWGGPLGLAPIRRWFEF